MNKPIDELKNRFKRAFDVRNVSQQELSEMTKIPKASISQYLSGYAKPKQDRIYSIAKALHINEAWLLGYDVSMDGTDLENPYDHSNTKPNRIPVLGSVPAGVPIEAIEDVVDWEDIPMEWLNGGKEYFGLKVKGDSMYPKYLENDTLIVRKEDDCESGQDCVVYVNGYDATLKKVIKRPDCIILQPLNPAYEPKIYDYNDEDNLVKIAGIVVEIRRTV